ncbi:MAG: hypothetical protein M0R77_08510 [Gammaproteobacteria bacterium]|nr:hypothetical protein [Gammaproteobacteria bacterium]
MVGQLVKWVEELTAERKPYATALGASKFLWLTTYFGREVVDETAFQVVPLLPAPPGPILPSGLADTEWSIMDGITLGATMYYVREHRSADPTLHFHELVHIVQYRLLGIEKFLDIYVQEHTSRGYRANRLEQMAYSAEAAFNRGKTFKIAPILRHHLHQCGWI